MKSSPVAWIYQNAYTDNEYLTWAQSPGGRNWRPLYTSEGIDKLRNERDDLVKAIERMRVAGGSHEFHMAFELAKDALARVDADKTANVELSGPTAVSSPEGPAQTQG